jgi:tRNA (guanine10-N2)-dimethyltransferase
MKFLFELSKEHKTLPTAEVLACLKAEKISYKIVESKDDVLVIETNTKHDTIKRLAVRLSLTFYVDEFLFSCPPYVREIKKYAVDNIIIEKKGSIAIRCKNRSNIVGSQPIVKTLAEIYSKERKVALKNPDIEIRGLITDSRLYVGLKTAEINRSQFENRKVQHRPFFSPVSLHPKLARALVNLSLIKKDEILLDPFCGTGGILIEAGLIGARIIGSDVEDKMIEGCKKNLDFYGIKNYELFCSDIGNINRYIAEVDAVVTDLPYGRSTTTKGEYIQQLYERAFENISKILKPGRRAVMGLSNNDMPPVGEKYFSLVEKHELRAHRSLTRFFAVYQK